MRRLLSTLVVLPIFLVGSCGTANETLQESPQDLSAASKSPAYSPVEGPTLQLRPITPLGIHILGTTAPITSDELVGNELVPPANPKVLGWWGSKPGSTHGATLLVGHTVHTGGGTLDNLEDVPVGATLVVEGWNKNPDSARAYQKMQYRVVSNRTISKSALAENAQSLFSQTGAPRLVIVTCEDYNWSTGEYASNVVLIAKPI